MPGGHGLANQLVMINKGLFLKRDPYTLLLFAYTLDPISFKRKFAEHGVVIKDEKDIPSLVELSVSGGDKVGAKKHAITNRPVRFSVSDVFSQIYINPEAFSQNKGLIRWV